MFTVPTLTSGAKPIYTSGWFVEPNGATWRGEALESYGNAKVLVPGTGHAIVLLGNTAPKERWKPGEVAGEIDNAARLKPALPPFLCRSCRPPGDLKLTAEEEGALVAFMKTLSDGYNGANP